MNPSGDVKASLKRTKERTRDLTGGKKFDSGKAELDMIPYKALTEAAKAFTIGKCKYGKWNYKKGMEWSKIINAMIRHAMEFKEGNSENTETFRHIETGETVTMKDHHLGAVIACASMLLDYEENGLGTDDRYKDDTSA